MTAIPAVLMRGGTSKGVFVRAEHLPPPGPERDDLLLRVMGSPDATQIDGMGGTFSSTSKVVVVEPGGPDELTYWFAQIGVDRPIVDWSGNCGNLTSAVGPYAVDEGLVRVTEPVTRLRLRNGNTGVTIEAEVPVADGRAATTGDLAIAGVPGTGAPVVTRYLDPGGAVLGATFPTGSRVDEIDVDGTRVRVSVVDVSHPYAFVRATDVGLPDESRLTPAELNGDAGLLARVERVRAACAVRVGAAPTADAAAEVAPIVPRIVLVHPDDDADVRATAFSMGVVHRALPMTAALCLGAAARLDGTVVAEAAKAPGEEVRIRHPRGIASAFVETRSGPEPIRSVGVVRTARRLMDGRVYPRPE
ncbi:hypothetical protein LO772_07140 [Yinghuangia sp. ASG 101]|uniref:PrpF domain-containing protein n=1 Tax=Yinghuangia sp. ASG 101 TaxID=2896848 RepID=UPI001E29DD33|nr:PrpF domain-containing protein [Yinghuangia sp. ASG 101]UGQ13375.1 hypothetical protein LO772_07140 [Yinghuangia sp. ASG 101]